MAEEAQTIRTIHWQEVLPFTRIFRAFRVAVHPSKLVLGLIGLLILYAGGRAMDGLWADRYLAVPKEVSSYQNYWAQSSKGIAAFESEREQYRERMVEAYASILRERKLVVDRDASLISARKGEYYKDIKGQLMFERNQALAAALKARDQAMTTASKLSDSARVAAERNASVEYRTSVDQIYARANRELEEVQNLRPRGIFHAFFEYETDQINSVIGGVTSWNWLGGLALRGAPGAAPADAAAPAGVLQSVINFLVVAPLWMVRVHPLYFILATLLFLVVWALFGGAIARIAAVHVARDEKLSVRAAFRFAFNKLLSFIFAPVIPLMIVLVVGAIMAAGGLLFYIPVVGPALAGALFFLALLGGFIVSLVLLGTVGGFNLMYPTIAVEGSDSFDAISRSFSYVFARPWRMLFYTVVAVVYGALTYLFVRFFIWLMLAVTHFFVSWLLRGQSAEYFPQMWPWPDFMRLPYDVNYQGLATSEDFGAALISFWVYLVISMLGAFAISFFFSANTIIYYLMRREVDATDFEEVYTEDAEDEFGELAPLPGGSAADTPPDSATPETAVRVDPPLAPDLPPTAPDGGPA